MEEGACEKHYADGDCIRLVNNSCIRKPFVKKFNLLELLFFVIGLCIVVIVA
jgi:hypothetical protein